MVPTLDRQQLVSLNLPEQILLQVTPEQFAQLAIANRDLRLERTATRVLIVNPPIGGETGKRNFNLAGQLSFTKSRHSIGGKGFTGIYPVS
jgi:Uma2 family endonuclease